MTRASKNVATKPDVDWYERLCAMEDEPDTTLLAELTQRGARFPSPEELTDEDLPHHLWRLIRSLADLCVYLHCTNHLSDRDLYVRLVHRELPMETDMPCPGGLEALHIDFASGGGEEDIQAHLKYYADDLDRAWWKQEFPDMVVPDHAPFPFDRDRFLPREEEARAGMEACGA